MQSPLYYSCSSVHNLTRGDIVVSYPNSLVTHYWFCFNEYKTNMCVWLCNYEHNLKCTIYDLSGDIIAQMNDIPQCHPHIFNIECGYNAIIIECTYDPRVGTIMIMSMQNVRELEQLKYESKEELLFSNEDYIIYTDNHCQINKFPKFKHTKIPFLYKQCALFVFSLIEKSCETEEITKVNFSCFYQIGQLPSFDGFKPSILYHNEDIKIDADLNDSGSDVLALGYTPLYDVTYTNEIYL